ncbi:MAG: S1 RNA-binding domain-containing protein [Anaerolineales bacterium]|jgi:small subunit ribosomal protein S1|nr:S1 RNA-binding domain-containing protein [Anaerolineales bacterium]
MVKQPNYREMHVEPPPMDESWWEAVMAEDEAKNGSPGGRNHQRAKSGRTSNDLPVVDWSRALELYESDQAITLLVTSYNRGGLLVNGEGLQGFVPVSHLVEAPQEAVESDEWLMNYLDRSLRLKVIECDPERGRVVFSERAALAEPGTRNSLLQSLQRGDRAEGVVTNITDFGVFVDLGGVEGLVHVSEISWGRVHHPADVVQVGQPVQVYVIQVDRERARIALSLKRLHPNPWETAETRYFPGQVTEAVVTSVVPFGAFARLEEGLDGLIHISEIDCSSEHTNPADLLQEGQKIRVRVLHVDGSRQRLGLSLRVDEIE